MALLAFMQLGQLLVSLNLMYMKMISRILLAL